MIIVENSRCDQCGTCVSVCAQGALVLNENPVIDQSTCSLCTNCVKVCPFGALSLSNEVHSV